MKNIMVRNTYEMVKDANGNITLLDEQLNTFPARCIIDLFPTKLFLFDGEMGSGKTTFIKHLCSQMECSSIVNSPTFAIINEYISAFGKIYHIDCYRLNNINEAIEAGIEECLYSNDYCFIEWPMLLYPILQNSKAALIHIKVMQDDKRILQISPFNSNTFN